MVATLTFPTPGEYLLRCGQTSAGILPDICLLSHFQADAWHILYRPLCTGNTRRWGMPLMIPNFSRLKNGVFLEKHTTLPIHGFGRDLPWAVIAHNETSLSMQLRSNSTTLAHYPYECTFTATITLAEKTLTYDLTMENHTDETMPIAPGFHPYFAITQLDKARLVLTGLPTIVPASIDWDNQPPDEPCPFPHQVAIQFPHQGVLSIAELPHDGRYLLTTMQVWSEPITQPDHEFVCFEPTVSSEDALNRPADRLNIPPHQSQSLTLQLKAQPQTHT